MMLLKHNVGVRPDPSLEDYRRFHGMLCGFHAAKNCIESFDGVALFADQTSYDSETTSLTTFDYNDKEIPALFSLNLWTYYLLVLFSLTGFCTLLGQTRLLNVSDTVNIRFEKDPPTEKSGVESKAINDLKIPSKVFDYIREKSNDNNGASVQDDVVIMKRIFEFDFGSYLSVMMIHFVCNGRQSLVEVYRIENNMSGQLAKFFLQQPMHLVRSLSSSSIGIGRERANKEKNR
jgi:hypothetical protein